MITKEAQAEINEVTQLMKEAHTQERYWELAAFRNTLITYAPHDEEPKE